ncbi:MAG: hypothetical protein PHN47_04680 [Clostridia bacterium]|jgi:hypothetical protein|nr:hypothetical protein [Clostridia bacterium]
MKAIKAIKTIKTMKKNSLGLAFILACLMFFVMSTQALAAVGEPAVSVDDAVKATAAKLIKEVPAPVVSSVGGEWAVMALARLGYTVPQSYYDNYYKTLVKTLQEKQGNLSSTKYTEYSRIILALTAIGKDVTNVGGYNLLEKLADFNNVKKQGVNGPVFALLALDSHDYEIPKVAGVKVQTTRQMLIDYILSKEITATNGKVGGFSLDGISADADITGMVIQAFSNYREQPKVEAAVQRALSVLSELQKTNGGYGTGGMENPESTAQVLLALTALGFDPQTDKRFIKDNTVPDGLMAYYITGGGFRHTETTDLDIMSTEQVFCSLVAYQRFTEGKSSFYDMTDVEIKKASVIEDVKQSQNTGKNQLLELFFKLPQFIQIFI